MMDRTRTICLFILVVVCGGFLPKASAQTAGLQRIAGAVTYVTPGSVYFNAGSNAGLAIGDTLVASHGTNALGKVVISAISSSSSAAQVLPGASTIAIGDTVFMMKHVEPKTGAEAETGRASRGWTPPE